MNYDLPFNTDATEINAVIDLLDDTDEVIYRQAQKELRRYGTDIIPSLEAYMMKSSANVLRMQRIEELIHSLWQENARKALALWCENGTGSLLKGIMCIAHQQDHDFEEGELTGHLSTIAKDIWLEFNNGLTALEKSKILFRILFEVHKIKYQPDTQHTPGDVLPGLVLRFSAGNELGIGLLAALLAESLDLPLFGMDIPGQFTLVWMDSPDRKNAFNCQPLFYINPMNGEAFGSIDIRHYLNENHINEVPGMFVPASNIRLIDRCIRHLIFKAKRRKQFKKVQSLEAFRACLDPGTSDE